MARKIHSDLADHFLYALDAKKKMQMGAENKFGYSRESMELSRTTVNKVLAKHGSPYGKLHEWKFKHAIAPNKLWQLDLKGPVIFNRSIFQEGFCKPN